jgi:NhaC family Na+:H+ antiporter
MKFVQPSAIPLWAALLPLFFLLGALAYNVGWVFGDDAVAGSNQLILLASAFFAAGVAAFFGRRFSDLFDGVANNLREAGKAMIILLLIGALSGTWLVSGVIPTLIAFGVDLLDPSYFLVATVLFCSVVSMATGSSWSTSATVGIALMGVGQALGFPAPVVAGAVISGAYFGDKLSPFSDTTNLAPAMAGTDLFTHIRYMTITTVPSYLVTLLFFIGYTLWFPVEEANISLSWLNTLRETMNLTPWLLLVPVASLGLMLFRVDALVAVAFGAAAGAVAALWAQPEFIVSLAGEGIPAAHAAYAGIVRALYDTVQVPSSDPIVADLLQSKGMGGMLSTVWLIISAMAFGGVMEAAGFLTRITQSLVSLAHSAAGLIGATLATCGLINITAGDQYLAIVVPGRMFKDAYRERGLAPENLSRCLEDSGTVTSALVPWNTCGAYQSATLGVATGEYFVYAVFNWVSPIMSWIIALIGFRIRKLNSQE